jgi:hypothetical protein
MGQTQLRWSLPHIHFEDLGVLCVVSAFSARKLLANPINYSVANPPGLPARPATLAQQPPGLRP